MKSKVKTKSQKERKKTNLRGKANLAWTIKDYRAWNIEPPEYLLKNSSATEGEQMSDNDIKAWFADSIKTLKILKETEPKIFERLYKGLIIDIKYLISIGRLNEERLDFVLDKNNFLF